MTLSLIVALGVRTRAIGKDNALLWHIPGDLPRFKALTMGHPVIMGARTFESIGKPLPGRTNIVVTHDQSRAYEGVIVCHSIDEALDTTCALATNEAFVIGGGMLYAQTIERADRLYLTLVDDDAEGDTHFPEYTHLPFTEVAREDHFEASPAFTFVTLARTQ